MSERVPRQCKDGCGLVGGCRTANGGVGWSWISGAQVMRCRCLLGRLAKRQKTGQVSLLALEESAECCVCVVLRNYMVELSRSDGDQPRRMEGENTEG